MGYTKAGNGKYFTIVLVILLCLFSLYSVSGWVYFESGSLLSTATGNVTYIVPTGGLNCTSLVIDNTCVNITGGIYEGNYCQVYSSPINLTLGNGSTMNIFTYNEQTRLALDHNATVIIVNDLTNETYNLNFNNSYNLNLTQGNYSVYYTATGFVQREYYLTQSSTDTFRLDLYFLNETISDRNQHVLTDEVGNVVEDIEILLQRYYPATDNYITVSMSKSNFEGESIHYIELYDVFYKLVYKDANGNILKTTQPSKFFSTTTTDKVVLTEDPLAGWRTYDDITYSFDFVNSTTDYYRFVWADTNNLVRTACLKVDFISAKGGLENMCYDCVNSTSGTLTCAVNLSWVGEYRGWAIIDTNTNSSFFNLELLAKQAQEALQYEFGKDGLFMTAVFAGSAAMMGIASMSGSLIFMLVGLIAMSVADIFTGGTYAVIAPLVAVTFIILYILNNKKG